MTKSVLKLYDKDGQECGSIMTTSIGKPSSFNEKCTSEAELIEHAFKELYPYEGLNIYRTINNDTPSIVAIKNINRLSGDFIK